MQVLITRRSVRKVPCQSKGIMIDFGKIEVTMLGRVSDRGEHVNQTGLEGF